MKYLIKREDYLVSIKESRNINDIYRKEKGVKLITEEVPFENDIPWGDSIVGRLINSVLRKAKIGSNITRINSCIRRLKDTFDDIILSSVVGDIPKEDKQSLARIMAASYFRAIQKAVDDYTKGEGSLDEIRNLVKSAIDYIEKDPQAENMPDKNEITRQLKDFLKFLEPLKDKDEEEGKKDVEEKGKKSKNKELYNKVIGLFSKNLSSVARLYLLFGELKKLDAQKYSSGQQQQYGSKLKQFQKEDRKKKVAEEIAKRKELAEKESINQIPSSKAESFRLQTFSSFSDFILEAEGSSEKSPILSELSKLYKSISSRGEKESSEIMQSILKGDSLRSTSGTLSSIKRIYEQIRIKMGLEVNKLNEANVETFISENEKSLQDGILSLYKVTKTNPKIPDNLIENKNILQKINAEILKFNSSMAECLSKDLYKESSIPTESAENVESAEKEKTSPAVENSFSSRKWRKIFEADEDEEKDEEKESTKTKVSKYWNEKMDLNKYAVTEAEVEKVKTEIEKRIATKKDSIEIQGMDPIIEIVKIFNRAYKLHTTQVIQSGRSGGKVSNSVFLEYHCFGDGTPATAGSGGGPYRNNAMFDKWESAVHDIMKKKEYQRIFNVGTVVKVGNEYIERAGSNLRKFMDDLISGDELYKGSGRGAEGKGAQSKFLDKYFGFKDADPTVLSMSGPGGPDADKNKIVAESINPSKIEFVKTPYKEEKTKLEGTFFTILTREANKEDKTYYCLIQKETNDYYYITLSRTGKYIYDGLKKSVGTDIKESIRVMTTKDKKQDTSWKIFATKIRKSKIFDGKTIKFPDTLSIGMIHYGEKNGKIDNRSGEIKSVELRDLRIPEAKVAVDAKSDKKEEQKLFTVDERGIKYMLQEHGGFTDIKSSVDSMNVEIK